MALARYIESKFGQKTRSNTNPVVAQCEIAATMLLRNNPDRLGYVIVNLGANNIYVCFDENPTATRGIYIQNGGGILSLSADEDFELVGYPVFGIAIGGVSAVFVQETEAE